jgi:sulfoxide reductase catalytic subunit YedY
LKRITRRQFGRLLAGGVVLSLVGGCSSEQLPSVGPSAVPESPATPLPTQPSPTAESAAQDDFFSVNFTSFQGADPAQWSLSVDGMVKKPVQLSLAEVQALPLVSQVSRMKCVECWSAPAKWGGFRYETLSAIVEPDTEASWVHFHCADGYYESLSVEELRMDRVLFVHRMNDAPLPDKHGAPLRMIVPFKYGYKGAKVITRLTFAKERLKGYWSEDGAFSVVGNIQQGLDHPVDLKETRPIDGGEIRYPDGPEARG